MRVRDQQNFGVYNNLAGNKVAVNKSAKNSTKRDILRETVFTDLDKDPLSPFNSTILSDDRDFKAFQEETEDGKGDETTESPVDPLISKIFGSQKAKDRPNTPYIKDKNGQKHLLSLYARDQSRRELIDMLIKGTKIQDPPVVAQPEVRKTEIERKNFQMDNQAKDVDVNELNLLKIRETTYKRYEQEYQKEKKKEYEATRKKSMLSRNPMVTFSGRFHKSTCSTLSLSSKSNKI